VKPGVPSGNDRTHRYRHPSRVNNPVAYHLIPAATWAGADPTVPLHPASLDDEGFVHLTHRMTDLVEVANALYPNDPRPHVVLTVRLASLTSPWRYDGDERYPHIYGPLDRGAITEVRPIPRTADGTFLPIERPDPRQRPDLPALLRALVDGGVRFVVTGSGGAALLGADLLPGDLDVCVAADEQNLERLGAVLIGLGARPRVWVPGWMSADEADGWRPDRTVESFDHLFGTVHGDLDVVFGSPAADGRGDTTHDGLLSAASTIEVDGRSVAIASPGHLLESKLASRRPKDLRARAALERLVAEGAG
jgi:uncharacterized protein (DUF952 family)